MSTGNANHASTAIAPSITVDPAILQGEIFQNLKHNLIVTGEDKARQIAIRFKDSNRRLFAWSTPGGIALSLWSTYVTTTFVPRFGVSADMLQGIHMGLLGASIVWFIYAVVVAICGCRSATVEWFIRCLKNVATPDALPARPMRFGRLRTWLAESLVGGRKSVG